MAHLFLGRKKELALLNGLFKKKSASLVVIRGRRRIGKSRLAQEFAKKMTHYIFSGLPPTPHISAEDQREEFARQLQRELKIPLPRADDWGDLFWQLAQHAQKEKVVLVLDEISWMGSKDATFLGKLKIAWDLYFKNNPRLVLILCGSVSSWIEANILSSTGFLGRISVDMVLEELSLAESNEFWSQEGGLYPNKLKNWYFGCAKAPGIDDCKFPHISNIGELTIVDPRELSHGPNANSSACLGIVSSFEKFKILSVTGGVPRYLEEILPSQSAEMNIQRLCFQKEGLLFNEFERIFSDLFSTRSAIYKTIVERLAEGPAELKDIYLALGVEKSGVISDYMNDLVTSGFVSNDFTWHLQSGLDSKLSRFRLKDNYLRFYLKYILPNKKKIEKQGLKLLPQWQSAMGLQFENLVLANRKGVQRLLGIDPSEIVNDNPFFQSKTTSRAGCQIDYMIQTKFGTCYLCEIKFFSGEISSDIIDEVKLKIKNLVLPKHLSIRPVLIHVNGVDKRVLQKDFFSSILDFSSLLE